MAMIIIIMTKIIIFFRWLIISVPHMYDISAQDISEQCTTAVTIL